MEQNEEKLSLTTSQQGNAIETVSVSLVSDVRKIIEEGRQAAYSALNTAMLRTFWNVGRRLVEEEQHGSSRAGYGEFLARNVADRLQSEYGHTYSYRNICYFRQFYLCFRNLEIVNSRVHNLTWTHFRHLLRVDDEKARLWYMNEAANQLWSTRELERNINTQYYFCLLANQKDKKVQAKYMLYMPTKEQLKIEIEREKELYRLQNPKQITD